MIKTSISRDKLYKRDYYNDDIELDESINKKEIDSGYNTLSKILTLIYMEKLN